MSNVSDVDSAEYDLGMALDSDDLYSSEDGQDIEGGGALARLSKSKQMDSSKNASGCRGNKCFLTMAGGRAKKFVRGGGVGKRRGGPVDFDLDDNSDVDERERPGRPDNLPKRRRVK